MLALLDEYAIDYIKWDHNRDLTEAGDRTRGGRPVVHEQTLAFYRLLRELKQAHPGLEIESCSSGGGRVDLGVLELTDRIWVSDNSDPHDRQSMMRWSAQLAPPEYLGAHIASDRSHTTGRRLDLSFRASTAIFGHLGIEWDLGEATDAELRLLARWIAFHKEHRGAAARRRDRAHGHDRSSHRRARRGRRGRLGGALLGRRARHDPPRTAGAADAARPRPGPHVPAHTGLHRHDAVRAHPARVVGRAERRRGPRDPGVLGPRRTGRCQLPGSELPRRRAGARSAWPRRACTPTRRCCTARSPRTDRTTHEGRKPQPSPRMAAAPAARRLTSPNLR